MFPTYITKLTFTGRTNLRSTRIIRTTWRKRRARRTDVARTRLSFPCSVESDNFMQSDSKKTNAVTISVVKSKVYSWDIILYNLYMKLKRQVGNKRDVGKSETRKFSFTSESDDRNWKVFSIKVTKNFPTSARPYQLFQ